MTLEWLELFAYSRIYIFHLVKWAFKSFHDLILPSLLEKKYFLGSYSLEITE